MFGAAWGKGLVIEQDRPAGRCSQFLGSLGAQLGAQSYQQLILFRTEAALATFKEGRIEFEGRASAVVFTAGVGEMAWQIREKALEGLEFMGIILDREKNRTTMTRKAESVITTPDSPVKVFVIPTDEELVFTEDVVAILEGTYTDHMNFQYSFSASDFQRK